MDWGLCNGPKHRPAASRRNRAAHRSGVVHLARQEALIAELEQDGHDAEAARAILATFRQTQALHQQDHERLVQEARMASALEDRTTIK